MAAFGLTILYGFAFVWLFIAMGLMAGSPQAAQGLSFLVFPLSFVSSAYVPVSTMPGWMQAFANNQPMTQMVNTVRLLTGGPPAQALLGHPVSYYLVPSLLWTAGLVVVFAPIAVWKLKSTVTWTQGLWPALTDAKRTVSAGRSPRRPLPSSSSPERS